MQFTRAEMTFQGYSLPKYVNPHANPFAVKQSEAWANRAFKDQEFCARSEYFVEISFLSGEDNDFLQVYPMRVVSYLAVS